MAFNKLIYSHLPSKPKDFLQTRVLQEEIKTEEDWPQKMTTKSLKAITSIYNRKVKNSNSTITRTLLRL